MPPRQVISETKVARLARRHSKALVETHRTHAQHLEVKVRPKGEIQRFFTFRAFRSVTHAAKSSNSPKCWCMFKKGTNTKVITQKGQGFEINMFCLEMAFLAWNFLKFQICH